MYTWKAITNMESTNITLIVYLFPIVTVDITLMVDCKLGFWTCI